MIEFKKVSDEVFLATDEIVRFDRRAIDFVKEKAMCSPRGRARICAHTNSTDSLHEMIIAIRSNSYIRPHRHHNKVESFHLIDGRADIIILDDDGDIIDVIELGKDLNFYYRLNTPYYHTVIVHSAMLVIHEITNGPFEANASDYAKFSPSENDVIKSSEYIQSLKYKIETNKIKSISSY